MSMPFTERLAECPALQQWKLHHTMELYMVFRVIVLSAPFLTAFQVKLSTLQASYIQLSFLQGEAICSSFPLRQNQYTEKTSASVFSVVPL